MRPLTRFAPLTIPNDSMLALLSLMIVICAFALPATLAAADGETTLRAEAIRASGQVRFTTDSRDWRSLKTGDSLPAGTLIRTAKKNVELQIRFGEGPASPTVRLADNVVFGVKSARIKGEGSTQSRTIQVELRSGQIEGSIPASSGALELEIELPTGVVGARAGAAVASATVYAVNASGAVAVASGRMVVALANGTDPQVVTGGRQFDPATGRVSALPKSAVDTMLEAARELR